MGGTEIEEVAAHNPDAIVKLSIDPTVGLDLATAKQWVADAKIDAEAQEQAAELLLKLYACYVDGDCDLEITRGEGLNPDAALAALLGAGLVGVPAQANAA